MRLLFALFLSALLCACASAPGTTPSATDAATESAPAQSTGVQWRYINSKSYEALNAGLGNSHRFESSLGWIDVCKGWQEEDK